MNRHPFQSHGASTDSNSTLRIVGGVLFAITVVIVAVLVFALVRFWKKKLDLLGETDETKTIRSEKRTPLLGLVPSTSQRSSATDATLANIPSIPTDEVSGKVRDSKGYARSLVIKR